MDEIHLNSLYSRIHLLSESTSCSYYPERKETQLYGFFPWIDKINEDKLLGPYEAPLQVTNYYEYLKEHGFCRYNQMFYKYECQDCKECTPIRIQVRDFKISKSQRACLNRNKDVEVTLVKDKRAFVSLEKAQIYRLYDEYHNSHEEGFELKTLEDAMDSLKQMNGGYEGTWNMEYRINGRLMGVSILDYTTDVTGKIESLCSNYFYYDVTDEVSKRSLGVFSVLKELEFCAKEGIRYYYLGLYLCGCHKMNYKTNFRPYQLYAGGYWLGSNEDFFEPGEIAGINKDICYIGGKINSYMLLKAYKSGAFPWFDEDGGEPVVWWSPDPRFVITKENFHEPKTIKKFLKHTPYTYTMDKAFDRVIEECSRMERKGQDGTWIGPEIIRSYKDFHKMGYAHSIEVWNGDKLVGGFYGELFGAIFFGESMFTIEDSSSSSAFILFARAFFEAGGRLIDCQMRTKNMARYGGEEMKRSEFIQRMKKCMDIRLTKALELQPEAEKPVEEKTVQS